MLDAPPRCLGFEVIADGGGEALPPMGRCDGQRSKKPHRLVEFEAANADQGAVRFDYHKAAEVLGDVGDRESCGLKEFGDRREVTWLCGSCHDVARTVQRHAFHQQGAKRALRRSPVGHPDGSEVRIAFRINSHPTPCAWPRTRKEACTCAMPIRALRGAIGGIKNSILPQNPVLGGKWQQYPLVED